MAKKGKSKKVSSKKASSKKTASRKGNDGGKLTGRTTGQSVREFCTALVLANEKAKRNKKLTDQQLQKKVIAEFPGRTSTQLSDPNGFKIFRSWYNRGGDTGEVPKVQSYAYDSNGDRLERASRNGEAKSKKAAKSKKSKKGKKSKKSKAKGVRVRKASTA